MYRPPIAKELKDQILARIKDEGVSVLQAAKDHGVSTKAIYSWLSKGTSIEPGILGFNRLRRENQALLLLIGKLTAEADKQKRGRS